MFSLSCTMSVAPTIVDVTNSRLYTHAKASCAGVRPIYRNMRAESIPDTYVRRRARGGGPGDESQESWHVAKWGEQRRERREDGEILRTADSPRRSKIRNSRDSNAKACATISRNKKVEASERGIGGHHL